MIKCYSLGNFIIHKGMDATKYLLSTFQCALDIDIQNFLKEKAILYEQQNISRTYLLIDECHAYLLAYYTIAIKEFQFNENLSRAKRKKYLGTSYEANKQFPALLIGQIGKNSTVPKEYQIAGKDIFLSIMDTISSIRELAGGRLIYVEAKAHPYLHTFYTSYNFMLYHDEQGNAIHNANGLHLYMLPSPKCF